MLGFEHFSAVESEGGIIKKQKKKKEEEREMK